MVSAWPAGRIRLGPKVVVFVHFDRAGAVREYAMIYLRAFAEAGFSIVFVTNSGRLQPAAMSALQQICACVLVRRNVGYDFGAWREGFAHLALPRPDTELVVMANDSVYGPLRPLDDLLAQIDFERADVWGLTESWQSRFHLQSYFLAFRPEVLASEAWRRFWTAVRPAPSKHWIIHRNEIGLTQALIRAGFRVQSVWPYTRLLQVVDPELTDGEPSRDPVQQVRRDHARRIREAMVRQVPMNPTSDLWRQLLLAGFPFIKRELLRSNPTQVPDVAEWQDLVERLLQADPGPIERDLQRTLRNRAP
ncbi:MAG TPA: rhamnan synthesis F family protein [Acetobacteraceae bacterium]|nr:rhamnan synthesis F family protein [Acetobacteraceae bacterium]